MRLLIRCDASPSIGGGHAMRCFALAQAAVDAGHDVVLAMAAGAEMMQKECAAERIKLQQFDVEPASTEDLEATRALVDAMRPDWLVIDGPGLRTALAMPLRSQAIGVLLLSDDGFIEPLHGVLVLNQNVWASAADYPAVSPRYLLLGTPFALLRRRFRIAPPAEFCEAVHEILVTFGAADPVSMTERFLRQIIGPETMPGVTFTIVIGPANPHGDRMSAAAARSAHIKIIHAPKDIASLMMRADLAISAAGVTLLELLRLGIPTIAVAIADDQTRNLAWLAERGIVHPLTMAALTERGAFKQLVAAVAADNEWRRKASIAGQQLVDGAGTARVLEALATRRVPHGGIATA